MRSTWSGPLIAGLLRSDVRLFKAKDDGTTSAQVPMHGIHRQCQNRIGNRVYCPVCADRAMAEMEMALRDGNDIATAFQRFVEATNIPRPALLKGYEYEPGKNIILLDTELANLPIPSAKQLEITDFLDRDLIDPMYFEDAYYMAPANKVKAKTLVDKPFVLIYKIMQKMKVVGFGKVTLGSKERLCCIRPFNGIMLVHTMSYAQQIRSPEDLPVPIAEISDREMELAEELIREMKAEGVSLAQYEDRYVEALKLLVTSKLTGRPLDVTEEPELLPTPQVDLVAQLMASVGLQKSKRRSFDFDEEKVGVNADE